MDIHSTPGCIYIHTVVSIVSKYINQNEVKRNGALKKTSLQEESPAAADTEDVWLLIANLMNVSLIMTVCTPEGRKGSDTANCIFKQQ